VARHQLATEDTSLCGDALLTADHGTPDATQVTCEACCTLLLDLYGRSIVAISQNLTRARALRERTRGQA
jgi:hypothetical protein